jgi:hypothetical protein
MNMKHKTFSEMHRDGKRENIKRFFGVVNQKKDMIKDILQERFKP